MIGIFDSGMGGLSTLKALLKISENAGLFFYTDHGFASYSTRSSTEIFIRARQGISTLFALGCPVVLVSCPITAAVAFADLDTSWRAQKYPDRHLISIMDIMVSAIATGHFKVPSHSHFLPPCPPENVAFLAPRPVVESGIFSKRMRKTAPKLHILQQPCPKLATALEEGWEEGDIIRGLERYAGGVLAKAGRRPVQLVVLGHGYYHLIRKPLSALLPAAARLVTMEETVLKEWPRISGMILENRKFNVATKQPSPYFVTTGDPEIARNKSKLFFDEECAFIHRSALTQKHLRE